MRFNKSKSKQQTQPPTATSKKQQELQPKAEKSQSSKRAAKQPRLSDADLEFIADSKAAALRKRTPVASGIIWSVGALMVIGLVWAKYAVLDEVTVGTGKVIPPSQVKVIQSLDGGIVNKILVSEGDDVKTGQILLRMDDTQAASSLLGERSKYNALLASTARLRAETEGKKTISFPKTLSAYPNLKARAQRLFKTRKKTLSENTKTIQRSYQLVKNELDITVPLVKEGVMSKLELLRLQRQANELQGTIDDEVSAFKEKAHTELNQQSAELSRLSAVLTAEKDRVFRTAIASPVNGTVKVVNVSTIGGVIKPGMDIMEIVPSDKHLLVEGRVRPSDIAFIRPGQPAMVKITAYDFSIYGGLKGKVKFISADTQEDKKGNPYYKVVVRTNSNHLGSNTKPLAIKPGMVASFDILTGRKSVLDYILKPLLKAKQVAMRER